MSNTDDAWHVRVPRRFAFPSRRLRSRKIAIQLRLFAGFSFARLLIVSAREAMLMSETPRPTYIVHLRPEPYCRDSIKALRQLLKRALRDWGLKCVGLSGTDKDAAP
jgi:hypothetical protein